MFHFDVQICFYQNRDRNLTEKKRTNRAGNAMKIQCRVSNIFGILIAGLWFADVMDAILNGKDRPLDH
jgi:hypothetical protein